MPSLTTSIVTSGSGFEFMNLAELNSLLQLLAFSGNISGGTSQFLQNCNHQGPTA
jgi:hypothetical protein